MGNCSTIRRSQSISLNTSIQPELESGVFLLPSDCTHKNKSVQKNHLSKNVLITEIFAFKSIAYLKADPGQYLTYLTITRSILA
ncbi:hypothetical protein NQ317_015816 [Molorchus minor]|uniref:Uncharacterized protein n=1 Tax=Molorchus minor TaxID=1323400 RepID=A0ABQ9JPS9_9CUCU|nr:hypothetical protein NQ317_015816 [Molorchus minor]